MHPHVLSQLQPTSTELNRFLLTVITISVFTKVATEKEARKTNTVDCHRTHIIDIRVTDGLRSVTNIQNESHRLCIIPGQCGQYAMAKKVFSLG